MCAKNIYNETIFLPKTSFSMRGNLPVEEPKTIEFWNKINLWEKIRKKFEDKPSFVLHDGPPYANGPIHMGTATNKILKDVINRIMQTEGYNTLYIPGWDCHGLPIEWQIEKEYRDKGKTKEEVSIKEFRLECRNFALKWIEEQKKSFIRLFILGDWEKPYLTMDYNSEAIILEEFSKFLLNGSLYRGSKPVMWSPVEKTALAEAEIEYKDISSKSIYVAFEISSSKNVLFKNAEVIIWTTTPWTIPGNQAIAFGKNIDYSLIKIITSTNLDLVKKKYIIASQLVEQVFEDSEFFEYEVIKTFKGEGLKEIFCYHPLKKQGFNQEVPLLEADFVDNTEGSGFVHIAPAYGEDDYYLAEKNNISIIDILNDNGTYKKGIPLLEGVHVFKAHELIIEKINLNNKLVRVRQYNHSYPHSWRSKKPIIYRATPQWFISMEKNGLRSTALKSIEETKWIPSKSKNRIRNMVETRPDWCVSRQRSWGVPLTIFIDKKTGKPLKDKNVMNKIIEEVKKRGSDIWLSEDPYKYLGSARDPKDFEVVRDILDVWFDSGSTHAFVLEHKLSWPADLYLEGTDQHRGFFQSSLLEACGTRGQAPYKAVITHGFVLDGNGRKMSKSLGNVVKPEDIIKKSGVDIMRLWVVTTDYSEDMRISNEILSNLSDYYRRIRNTFRFILGIIENVNLKEYKNNQTLFEMDKFILAKIYDLSQLRKVAIKSHVYHNFYKALFEFCSVDLSAFYFDISKDVLYCDSLKSEERKAKVFTLYKVYDILISWFSPVLCHTMEEVWSIFKTEDLDSVHLKLSAPIEERWKNKELIKKWENIKKIRRAVNTSIEEARNEKKIGSSLEAEIVIQVNDDLAKLIEENTMDKICMVANIKLKNMNAMVPPNFITSLNIESENIKVWVYKTSFKKCLRCWQYKEDIKEEDDLCIRCRNVIN